MKRSTRVALASQPLDGVAIGTFGYRTADPVDPDFQSKIRLGSNLICSPSDDRVSYPDSRVNATENRPHRLSPTPS